ncbi:5'-nucleotidase C-terminal domain-containing protein, partial [Ruminococcaceae bacterium OttesenSCG-928-L11]|nr:5'-nucleotidase C-terminal domain-containing protein [Ruminococcaceae bacterium OttesenSCG-928-L11]
IEIGENCRGVVHLSARFAKPEALRKETAGPIFTHGNLREIMPYDDRLLLVKISGAQLRRMLLYMLRDETLSGGHGEFYQFSKGLVVTYNRTARCFDRFEYGILIA